MFPKCGEAADEGSGCNRWLFIEFQKKGMSELSNESLKHVGGIGNK
jgi:hypothetical protein